MISLSYRKIRNTRDPALIFGSGVILKVYCPDDLPESVLLPCSDIIIPSGLVFPGFRSYRFIPTQTTLPSNDAYSIIKHSGNRNTCLLMDCLFTADGELTTHLINLGNSEIIIHPGKPIMYCSVIKIEQLELNEEQG